MNKPGPYLDSADPTTFVSKAIDDLFKILFCLNLSLSETVFIRESGGGPLKEIDVFQTNL